MTDHTELPVVDADTGHACGCQEHEPTHPELDARVIPHALRHGAILGALSRVRPGKAMVLVAPHNPLPLLKQIGDLEGDAIEVSYLDEGPETWRIKLTRKA